MKNVFWTQNLHFGLKTESFLLFYNVNLLSYNFIDNANTPYLSTHDLHIPATLGECLLIEIIVFILDFCLRIGYSLIISGND